MKIDRLIAITMYLLNRDTVSAAALAKRFEVSKRTIQRDIDTLNQAGIPIVSNHGAKGGYGIIDGFRLTKQIADTDDYLNIIIALQGLCSAYDNQKTTATLEKVLTAMQGSEQRIFVDFTAAREGLNIDAHLRIIEKAIFNETLLNISYSNADGVVSKRVIEPLILTYQWYSWYLFAYCDEKKDYRLFKLPRIISCSPISGSFSIKHDNIEVRMRAQSSADDRKRYRICLKCKKAIRQQVFEYLGSEIIEEFDNGDFILLIQGLPFERLWFSLLMGFGSQVEVLEPVELKDMLREKAREILSIY
ncbi:MAG: helix-turn-helix transcriptional regulator [Lachnospiraceae bacterium]